MKYKRSCGLLFFRHSFFFGFVSGDSEKSDYAQIGEVCSWQGEKNPFALP